VNPTQTIPAVAPAGRSPDESKSGNPRTVPFHAVLAVLAFCAFWILLGSVVVEGARLHDFLNLYTGASLAHDGAFTTLHAPGVQMERELKYAPQLLEVIPFVRPSFYALFLAPLAWLPFGTAFWSWLAVQGMVLVGTWAWAFRRWGADALIFGSMYLPTSLGIAHGQDCVLIFLIVLGTFALAEREQHFLSGVVLGAGLIKFHLFLLWPVMLLIERRWKMLISAILTLAVLTSIALPFDPRLLQHYHELATSPYMELFPSGIMWGPRMLLGGIGTFWIEFVPPVIGLIWFSFYWRKQKQTWNWTERLPLIITVSVLTSAYGWQFDQTLLLPAVIYLAAKIAKPFGRVPGNMVLTYTAMNCLLMALWPFPTIGLLPAPVFLLVLLFREVRRSAAFDTDARAVAR